MPAATKSNPLSAPQPGPQLSADIQETIEALQMDVHLASLAGPAGGLEFLRQRINARPPLPRAALKVAYTLMADAQARMNDWEACQASVELALALDRLPEPELSPESFDLEEEDVEADPPSPAPAPGAAAPPAPAVKLCRQCGKDVTHKSRRKNPATGSYLCSTCYHAQRETRARQATLRKWLVRGLLLTAIAAVAVGLILAELLN